MRRTHIGFLLAVIVTLPAVAAGAFFSLGSKPLAEKPCFISGNAGYQISAIGKARHIVRIDNQAAMPHLRMQLVDDPATADFVLVDDSDATAACAGVSAIESIRIDPAAEKPDLIVSVSRNPADYKIYLHSDKYNEQDAAALAAVIWQTTSKTGSLRTVSR
jgi:hypothetical protein